MKGTTHVDDQTIHRRRWAILGVLVVSLLVVVLDNTVLNVALKTIQLDLGATQSELQWSINSYTLVFAGLMFTFGLLGDRFGRKRILILGLILFGAASALSAYSGSPEQLIAARAVMGIGAAAAMPATLAIITNVFGAEERGRAIGIWVASVGIAVVLGPVLGGALLEQFWWGSVFLINVPVILVGLVFVFRLVPESRDPRPSRLDPVGVGLSIVGLTLLVYGIIEGGERAGFADAAVWAPTAGGLVALGLFVWYELRTDHPALDVRLFRNPAFSASVSSIGLMFFAMMGAFFFMTFYLQLIRGFSPLETGLLFLPFAIAQFTFSPGSAAMVQRFGVRAVAALGLGLVTLSLAGLLLVDADSPMWYLEVLFFIQGMGMANVIPPATTAIMASVPREKAGVGSAVNSTMRQVGGALGVAVLGALLAVRYRNDVEGALAGLSEGARDAAGESLASTLTMAEQAGVGETVRGPAFDAFISGMHWVAGISAVAAAVSVLVVLRFLPGRAPGQADGTEPSEKESEPLVS